MYNSVVGSTGPPITHKIPTTSSKMDNVQSIDLRIPLLKKAKPKKSIEITGMTSVKNITESVLSNKRSAER